MIQSKTKKYCEHNITSWHCNSSDANVLSSCTVNKIAIAPLCTQNNFTYKENLTCVGDVYGTESIHEV